MEAFIERQIFFEQRCTEPLNNDEEGVEPGRSFINSSIMSRARVFDDYSDQQYENILKHDLDQDQEEPGSCDWEGDNDEQTQMLQSSLNQVPEQDTSSLDEDSKSSLDQSTPDKSALNSQGGEDRTEFLLAKLRLAMQSKYKDIFDHINQVESKTLRIHRSSISKKALQQPESTYEPAIIGQVTISPHGKVSS